MILKHKFDFVLFLQNWHDASQKSISASDAKKVSRMSLSGDQKSTVTADINDAGDDEIMVTALLEDVLVSDPILPVPLPREAEAHPDPALVPVSQR